jgi:hypothetical protein
MEQNNRTHTSHVKLWNKSTEHTPPTSNYGTKQPWSDLEKNDKYFIFYLSSMIFFISLSRNYDVLKRKKMFFSETIRLMWINLDINSSWVFLNSNISICLNSIQDGSCYLREKILDWVKVTFFGANIFSNMIKISFRP